MQEVNDALKLIAMSKTRLRSVDQHTNGNALNAILNGVEKMLEQAIEELSKVPHRTRGE